MSAMIALLLVLSALCGCAGPLSGYTGEALANVKNVLPAPAAAVVLSVEVEAYEDTVRDEDGTVLAECAYELPVMRALLEDGSPLEEAVSPEQERALAAAETFNARFSDWKSNARTVAEGAKEDRAFRNEAELDPVTYTDDLRCSVYQTERLISVSGLYSTYTGGVHPNSILMSWNFDLDAGEFFEPEMLDEGGDFRDVVQRELLRKAREAAAEAGAAPEDLYWEDYEDTLAEWASYAVSFDAEGMTVGFSPYELGSYALGPQVFQLPYETLRPHLGPRGMALLGLEESAQAAD